MLCLFERLVLVSILHRLRREVEVVVRSVGHDFLALVERVLVLLAVLVHGSDFKLRAGGNRLFGTVSHGVVQAEVQLRVREVEVRTRLVQQVGHVAEVNRFDVHVLHGIVEVAREVLHADVRHFLFRHVV